MGAFADSLFTLLLGWVRGVVNAIMTVVSSGGESGLLTFLGRHWLVIVLTIVAVGLVGDWFIWMVRWQPYRVWGTHMRRVARALHITREEQTETGAAPEVEQAAPAEVYAPPEETMADMMAETMRYQTGAAQEENIDFAPEAQADLDLPPLTQEDEAQAYAAADGVEDAQLGNYPGMRYDMSTYMRPEAPAEGLEMMPEEAQNFDDPAATSAYGEERVEGSAAYAPYETPGEEQGVDQDGTELNAALEEAWNAPAPAMSEDEPQDVEFSQEFDPMADDVLSVELDAGSRRRRRRRGDARDTQVYTVVHSHDPTNGEEN